MTTVHIRSNAIELIKAGKKAEAQKLLEPYIDANPQDVTAWLWEVETWPSIEKKIKVLEMCLRHNPNNQETRRTLAALKAQKLKTNPVNTEGFVIEDKSVKSRKKLGDYFSPNTWFGRLRIIAVTVQIAIFTASLIINSHNNGHHSLISIVNLIVNSIFMAFALPVSWPAFPMGLVHHDVANRKS